MFKLFEFLSINMLHSVNAAPSYRLYHLRSPLHCTPIWPPNETDWYDLMLMKRTLIGDIIHWVHIIKAVLPHSTIYSSAAPHHLNRSWFHSWPIIHKTLHRSVNVKFASNVFWQIEKAKQQNGRCAVSREESLCGTGLPSSECSTAPWQIELSLHQLSIKNHSLQWNTAK